MNLNSILIGSENPERLVDYYTKLFGEPTWNDGGYTGWMIGSAPSPSGRTTRSRARTPAPGGSSGTSRART